MMSVAGDEVTLSWEQLARSAGNLFAQMSAITSTVLPRPCRRSLISAGLRRL